MKLFFTDNCPVCNTSLDFERWEEGAEVYKSYDCPKEGCIDYRFLRIYSYVDNIVQEGIRFRTNNFLVEICDNKMSFSTRVYDNDAQWWLWHECLVDIPSVNFEWNNLDLLIKRVKLLLVFS